MYSVCDFRNGAIEILRVIVGQDLPDDVITFSITPVNGYRLFINSIYVQGLARQGRTISLRTGIDNFQSLASPSYTYQQSPSYSHTFILNTPISTTTGVSFRLSPGSAGQQSQFTLGGLPGNDLVVNGPDAIPLPVNFTNIKASKKSSGIEVSFSNLTESDVVSYSIERSANGQQYSSIKELAPAKNDGGSADYSYTDAQPLNGNNLYCIKAVETNGKISYSAVARVDLNAIGQTLTIAPNPAKATELGLQITNLPAGNYKIRIFNNNAQVVGEQLFRHNGGSFSQTLPLNRLQSGMYYLELNGVIKMRKQFIIQ